MCEQFELYINSYEDFVTEFSSTCRKDQIWQKSICMKVIPETSLNVLFDFIHKINESGACSKEKTAGFFLLQ